MAPIIRPFDGSIDKNELHVYLKSLNFTVQINGISKPGAASYPLQDGVELANYCYLLSAMRIDEHHMADGPAERRIMGRLWYGDRYDQGLVLEVFGSKTIGPHMLKIARRIQEDLSNEVQVIVRLFKKPRLV